MGGKTEAMMEAIERNDPAAFERALRGADFCEVNGAGGVSGWTPLMSAASRGRLWAVEGLLRSGARVDLARGDAARSPLILACGKNEARCAEALIRAGADMESLDPWGKTALSAAAESGGAQCVRALLKAGANPNALDPRGMSALSWAAMSGEAECAYELARAGADANQKSASGLSALQWARGVSEEAAIAVERGLAEREADELGGELPQAAFSARRRM